MNLVGGLILGMVFNSNILFLFWSFLWATSANFLYFKEVTLHVRNLPDELADRRNSQKGGVSKAAMWMGVAFAFVFVFSSIQYMSSELLDKYGEEISDILPGSGSLTRGDGSVLDEAVEEHSDLAKTVVSLRVLARSIKMLMVGVDSNDEEALGVLDNQGVRSVNLFIEKIREKGIADPWGTEIKFEYRGDHYVIISAGPDLVFSTSDDVLQRINIVSGRAT